MVSNRSSRGMAVQVRTVAAVLGLWTAGSALAASPPCALNPLWRYQDQTSVNVIGPAVSDAAGNLFFLRSTFSADTSRLAYDVLSLDPDGHLRFRREIVSPPAAIPISDLAIIGGNAMLVGGSTTGDALTMVAVRTSDGTIAWTRNLISDLRGLTANPIASVSLGTPARGNGYMAVPLSYVELAPGGLTFRHDVLGAYDPATGSRIGIVQSAPFPPGFVLPETLATLVVDEGGNLYVASPRGGESSPSRLDSWQANGDFRYTVPAVSELLATGSGLLAGGMTFDLAITPPQRNEPFEIRRASNGVLLGQQSIASHSPLISGNRLIFVECTLGAMDFCSTAALTSLDIPSSTLEWRTPLATSPGELIRVRDPILTTVGSVLFLQQSIFSPATLASAIREFDRAGNEFVTCAIPADQYRGFTLAGSRIVTWTNDGRVVAFNAFDHAPAAHGWVMTGGSPQDDRRPR